MEFWEWEKILYCSYLKKMNHWILLTFVFYVFYLPLILMSLDISYRLWPSSMFPNFFLPPIVVFLYPTSNSSPIFQLLTTDYSNLFMPGLLLLHILIHSTVHSQDSHQRIFPQDIYFSVSWIWSSFSSIQSLSHVQLATPWITARQDSLSTTNSQTLRKLTSVELVMSSSHLILCRPLLLLPPIPPSIPLTRQTFVGKVMSLLFNMLSRLVITFLPRSVF